MALKRLHQITCRLLPGSCSCDTSETIGDFDMKKYNEINGIVDSSSVLLCAEAKVPMRKVRRRKGNDAVAMTYDDSVSSVSAPPGTPNDQTYVRLWFRSAMMVAIVYQLLYVSTVIIMFSTLYMEFVGMDVFGEEREKIVTQTYHTITSSDSISWLFQDGYRFKQLADTLIVAWLMTNYTLKIRCLLTFILALPAFFLLL